ncbi:Ubiquitin carboxyl-terminal hydrolase 32 [Portunus trituberculatus]|uniref:ubiquitinyl hydrolase 1 n=1 Tax=Portunus trituberculatus TaxID=210409 RepID=A0A5B7DFI7_PORTR|nr:Ubiquitin carboxyl-terminal hydrolase 32 [Portunus trituberculatus]
MLHIVSDDSLGYEFPFVLRAVEREGLQCAWCPWYKFCRGCQLPCEDKMFPQNAAFLAIDWDPTALHLRYQSGLERVFMEHSSVEEMRRKHVEPIALSDCLEAFCSEEVLDYSCDKCQKVQQAAKKLQIWRLPPVLIVHLKRFQFVGNKWIKSQKIVNFPLKDFDPTEYLASVPRQTIYMHRAELEGVDPAVYLANLPDKDNVLLDIVPENKIIEHIKGSYDDDSSGRSGKPSLNGSVNGSILSGGTSLCPSTTHEGSLGSSDFGSKRRIRNGSVLYGDTLQDFHQHRLEEGYDPLDLKYSLYAIAEVNESQIDLNSAYMLFYQREGLSVEKYMPNVDGKVPFPKELDEENKFDMSHPCEWSDERLQQLLAEETIDLAVWTLETAKIEVWNYNTARPMIQEVTEQTMCSVGSPASPLLSLSPAETQIH